LKSWGNATCEVGRSASKSSARGFAQAHKKRKAFPFILFYKGRGRRSGGSGAPLANKHTIPTTNGGPFVAVRGRAGNAPPAKLRRRSFDLCIKRTFLEPHRRCVTKGVNIISLISPPDLPCAQQLRPVFHPGRRAKRAESLPLPPSSCKVLLRSQGIGRINVVTTCTTLCGQPRRTKLSTASQDLFFYPSSMQPSAIQNATSAHAGVHESRVLPVKVGITVGHPPAYHLLITHELRPVCARPPAPNPDTALRPATP
jgi:hypothetical protein